MKRFLFVSMLALAPVVSVAGCATSRSLGEQVSDSRITRNVNANLVKDPETRRFPLDVDTVDRVVILRGEVDTKKARRRAEQVVYNTEGVMKVENMITLESEKAKGKDHHAKMDTGADASTSRPIIRDPFDKHPDAWISMRVRSALVADDDVRSREIDIHTRQSVVTLSGKVRDEQTAERAERLTRRVEGVKGVKNEIVVAGSEFDNDQSILEVEPDSILHPNRGG